MAPPSSDPETNTCSSAAMPSGAEATAEQIEAWSGTYGTRRRQIYRWIKIGREHSDPCPLDHPEQMPGWWSRRMKHSLPAKISAASAKLAKMQSVASEDSSPNSVLIDLPAAARSAPGDLTIVEMGEGEAVRQARQIVAMCYEKIEQAINAAEPNLDAANLWQVRWEKSAEALRKQERDDREARKQSGDLLPKAQLLTEAAQLLETLRLAHGSMEARIIAEMEKRLGGRARRVLLLLRPALLESIAHVRDREADLLIHIDAIRSREQASEMFTLAA